MRDEDDEGEPEITDAVEESEEVLPEGEAEIV